MSDNPQVTSDATLPSDRTNSSAQGDGPASYAADSTTNFKPLLDGTQPQLYRHNAFRILGVSAYATERDIRRQIEKIEMMEKVGSAAKTGGLLPVEPPPSRDAVREAMQRLSNPERRLIEEVFWFWPQDEGVGSDEAFAALTAGDTSRATEIWKGQENEEQNQVRATHNLAVLSHLSALDLELDARSGSSTSAPESERNQEWQKAFSYWGMLIDDERFWIRLNKRVRELDDPRLTVETARRIRASLPLALLSINAQLALQAAEVGEAATAHLHNYLISQSGFDQDAIDEAVQGAAQPIREQIKTSCRTAKSQVEADPSQAEQVVRRLFAETQPLLSTLDGLLPAGNPTRDGAHDEITATARESLLLSASKLANWKVAAEVLELFSEIPVAESERTGFKKDIDLFRDNAEYQGITHDLKPIESAPGLSMNNGFGVKLYGHADYDSKTKSYLATHYFIFLEIPILPLGRYRVSSEGDDTYRFYGKAPFRTFDKIHLAIGLIVVLVPIWFPIIIFNTTRSNVEPGMQAKSSRVWPKNVPVLVEAIKEGHSEASKALENIHPQKSETVEELETALEDSNPIVRRSAASALSNLNVRFELYEKAVRALIVALKDQDQPTPGLSQDYVVSVIAADTLRNLGPTAEAKRAIPVLEDMFRSKQTHKNARIAAIKAIWNINPNAEESVGLVVEALEDRDKDVRANAAKIISNTFFYYQVPPFNRQSLEAGLEKARKDKNSYAEGVIIEGLNKVDPNGAKSRRVLTR